MASVLPALPPDAREMGTECPFCGVEWVDASGPGGRFIAHGQRPDGPRCILLGTMWVYSLDTHRLLTRRSPKIAAAFGDPKGHAS